MRILHTGDLHIGKSVNGFSLLDDQEHILRVILEQIREAEPDALVIAGDVYDKQVPSAEAVALFDRFLTDAAGVCRAVLIVPGNHDSTDRLSFGSGLFKNEGVYIVRTPDLITLRDAYGEVDFALLPFIRPSLLRAQDAETPDSSMDAVAAALAKLGVDPKRRSVLVSHQFYTGKGIAPVLSESESFYAGGADSVDISVLAPFDFNYAAFGHLHGPQSVGRPAARYSGSPLMYSFSETTHKKSVAQIDLDGEGRAVITLLPLVPRRLLRKIKGTIEELTRPETVLSADPADYLHVTLTDEEEIYDAIGKLRVVYPNVMQLELKNSRHAAWDEDRGPGSAGDFRETTPFELFKAFFESQNNREMTPEQERVTRELLEDAP